MATSFSRRSSFVVFFHMGVFNPSVSPSGPSPVQLSSLKTLAQHRESKSASGKRPVFSHSADANPWSCTETLSAMNSPLGMGKTPPIEMVILRMVYCWIYMDLHYPDISWSSFEDDSWGEQVNRCKSIWYMEISITKTSCDCSTVYPPSAISTILNCFKSW